MTTDNAYISYDDAQANMAKGGPGLDGYAYQADVYCPECAADRIMPELESDFPIPEADYGDSDRVPVPVFFGEADTEQNCAQCGAYLYGGD